MPSLLLRLATAAVALPLSACGCNPPIGAPAAELVERCGQPLQTFSADTSIHHEEWLYEDDVYIGLIDGQVSYILK